MIDLGIGHGGFLQPYGLRYIINPDDTIPLSQRLLRIEVFAGKLQGDASAGTWKPISTNTYYRVGINNFIRFGGDGYTMFSNVFNANDFGPVLDDIVVTYIKSNSPLTPTVQESLNVCMTAKDFIGDSSDCLILFSSSRTDLSTMCPCRTDWCLQNGDLIMLDGLKVNKSRCTECSGLGKCVNFQCECYKSEYFALDNIKVVRGESCSDVRSIWSPSNAMVMLISVLYGATTLIIIFIVLYYVKKWKHPVIASSSPIFLVMMCLGALIGCGSVLASLLSSMWLGKAQDVAEDHSPLLLWWVCGLKMWLLNCGFTILTGE